MTPKQMRLLIKAVLCAGSFIGVSIITSEIIATATIANPELVSVLVTALTTAMVLSFKAIFEADHEDDGNGTDTKGE